MIKQYLKTVFGRKQRIYIAGPVTGLERSFVMAKFHLAECELYFSGVHPVVPVRFVPDGTEWADAMQVCLKLLSACHGIYMLDGWEKSEGASLELFVALVSGKDTYFENEAPDEIDFLNLLRVASKYLPMLTIHKLKLKTS